MTPSAQGMQILLEHAPQEWRDHNPNFWESDEIQPEIQTDEMSAWLLELEALEAEETRDRQSEIFFARNGY
jgi:hypothetical protein